MSSFIIRLLSKLHSIAKIAILGVLIVKFFDHMSNMLSKFTNQSAQKSSTFPIKVSFERSLLEFAAVLLLSPFHGMRIRLREFDPQHSLGVFIRPLA